MHHEENLHLQASKRVAITEPRDATEGVWQRVVNDLGSAQGQAAGGQAPGESRQSLWRKRRAKGEAVHERDQEG